MRLRPGKSAVFLLFLGVCAGAQENTQLMGTKEDRLFWLIPNYQTVAQERGTSFISAEDKFLIAGKDSLDPFAFPAAGLFAGISYAQNQYPSYGRSPTGFGRYYLGALADQTVSNVFAEGVFPVMLHQDPRFFRLGRGGIWHRLGYAATRVFVTRGDGGDTQFNYSEFGGNAVMAVGSNLYHPAQGRSTGDTAANWGIQMGVDTVGNIFKEFWPDIKEKLTGKRDRP
jgi:hypothetical protein